MKSKIQALRDLKGLTQAELSDKSGLSLRTIQRMESGSLPKGFTLKAIAKALETEPEKLLPEQENTTVNRAKLINLATLTGFIIPFSGIIFSLILTYKTKDSLNKDLGKSIVSFQIILTSIFSVLMIVSPFIQKGFSLKFPLFLIPLILFMIVKLFIIFKNGMCLNQKKELYINLKFSIL